MQRAPDGVPDRHRPAVRVVRAVRANRKELCAGAPTHVVASTRHTMSLLKLLTECLAEIRSGARLFIHTNLVCRRA